VARALGTLPRLAEALAHGALSCSKVRALTRVATSETEERLVAVGKAGTAAHVERIVRAWRAVDRKAEVQEAARRHASSDPCADVLSELDRRTPRRRLCDRRPAPVRVRRDVGPG
jgi:hypothetical protein